MPLPGERVVLFRGVGAPMWGMLVVRVPNDALYDDDDYDDCLVIELGGTRLHRCTGASIKSLSEHTACEVRR